MNHPEPSTSLEQIETIRQNTESYLEWLSRTDAELQGTTSQLKLTHEEGSLRVIGRDEW
jgi:hypothetical protein